MEENSVWRYCHSSFEELVGIVVLDFDGEQVVPHRGVNIHIGQIVRIEQECESWYLGWILEGQTTTRGIFPKSAVRLKAAQIHSDVIGETIIFIEESAVAQEIYSTLKEWHLSARNFFLSGDPTFEGVLKLTYDLVEIRKQILSGTLPNDEIRRLQRQAVQKLDEGNYLLGLDTVIRNDEGIPINLDSISLIETYRLFKVAPKVSAPAIKENAAQSYSLPCCLMLTIEEMTCKIGGDAEIIVSLFDEFKQLFLSENIVLEYKNGSEYSHNGRVFFADLKASSNPARLFCVCQIIRRGALESKDLTDTKKLSRPVRRLVGVAALDVTKLMQLSQSEKNTTDESGQIVSSVVFCGESDSLFGTLKRAIALRTVENHRPGQSTVTISGKLLQGGIKQGREEHPHLFVGNPPVSRILGYPDVPVPGDIRNDIYISLDRGEFKNAGRNIEVTVSVCDERGQVIPKAVCAGVGVPAVDCHSSVVCYHDDKPKWAETLKVTVSFEQFATSHVRFLFKQRSSNETKDKADKPFALAYLPLKSEDGTALADKNYRLALYRIDQKKYAEENGLFSSIYLNLPSEFVVESVQSSQNGISFNSIKTQVPVPSSGCYTYSTKETFVVSSMVCSTKLTQNVNLLGLLKWKSNPMVIENNLSQIARLEGSEVIRFLQDILDVLFDISSLDAASSSFGPPSQTDKLILEVLVYLIDLVSRNFSQFRPILDAYILDNFCAALAYQKLMYCLQDHFCNLDLNEEHARKYFIRIFKSLEYLFRFIVQSRLLYVQLNKNEEENEFRKRMISLLGSISDMMGFNNKSESFRIAGGVVLKYVPSIIPDLLKVIDPMTVSDFYVQIIHNVPDGQIFPQQVESLSTVVQGPLFRLPQCRKILLPHFCEYLQKLLEAKKDTKGCATMLSEMLILFSDSVVAAHGDDLSVMVSYLLRDIVRTVIYLPSDKTGLGEDFLVILLSTLRVMTDSHYENFISTFSSNKELLDFLQEIFVSFRSYFSKCVFHKEWSDMIMLQNTVMLEALTQFSLTIRSRFLDPFEFQLWNNFFECSVAFCTQESLQLETFSENKRKRIIKRYGDMRLKMCREIRAMWNSLGNHKRKFVPDLLASLLDMSLIPVVEVRRDTIFIFVDMMQCEFRLPKNSSAADGTLTVHGRLVAFEDAMIKNLDVYIEGGRGDSSYINLFEVLMTDWCNNNIEMGEKGLVLVNRLVEQMRLLLEYRSVMTSPDVDIESRMCCTVNLLEYYEKICKRQMYIRYLYKLRDLHLDLYNFTEVAFTLDLHARLLLWTDESLPSHLRSAEFPNCETHRELKEKLFYQMIDYFDKGKAWEYAINRETGVFKELQTLYETDTYEYEKLSSLLRRMADFHDRIISPQETRVPCEYFRVAYWGKGFPTFWCNKAFVFRGKECDNIRDFTERMQNRFPGCTTLKTMELPGDDITESDMMYLQVWKVEPDRSKSGSQLEDRFSGKPVSHRIRSFYLSNDITTFTYHRRLQSGSKDDDFAKLWLERTVVTIRSPLPGILSWSLITNTTTESVSPIRSAIETLQSKNDDIYRLVEKHLENPNAEFDRQGESILGGVLDPAVNGGISNYEKAFFSQEYIAAHTSTEDQEKREMLKDLIACQIPLLEVALDIYSHKVKDSMRPFFDHINACLRKQKLHVESNYGIRPPPFPKLSLKKFSVHQSFNNVDKPKSNYSTIFYTPSKEDGHIETVHMIPQSRTILPKKVNSRTGSTLSLRNSVGRESAFSLTLSAPIELNQPLQPQRKLRNTTEERERRSSRPISGGSFQLVRRLSLAEEEPHIATSPPPLPVKHVFTENGFATTPRKNRIINLDLAPQKPPLPSVEGGAIPALPVKRRSVSPKITDGDNFATPPPVPIKTMHSRHANSLDITSKAS